MGKVDLPINPNKCACLTVGKLLPISSSFSASGTDHRILQVTCARDLGVPLHTIFTASAHCILFITTSSSHFHYSGVGCCRQLAVNSHRKTLIISGDTPHGKPAVTLFRQLFSAVSLKMAVACQVLHVPNGACRNIEDKGIEQHWKLMQGILINCPLRLRAGFAPCKIVCLLNLTHLRQHHFFILFFFMEIS